MRKLLNSQVTWSSFSLQLVPIKVINWKSQSMEFKNTESGQSWPGRFWPGLVPASTSVSMNTAISSGKISSSFFHCFPFFFLRDNPSKFCLLEKRGFVAEICNVWEVKYPPNSRTCFYRVSSGPAPVTATLLNPVRCWQPQDPQSSSQSLPAAG